VRETALAARGDHDMLGMGRSEADVILEQDKTGALRCLNRVARNRRQTT
jgi:hypothetical protein